MIKPITKLTSIPVVASAGAWQIKVVTTDPPKLIPHNEYFWTCKLHSDLLLATVTIAESNDWFCYAKSDMLERAESIKISFLPFDWKCSNMVDMYIQSSGTFVGIRIENEDVKFDPRRFTKIYVENGMPLKTGSIIDVATVKCNNSTVQLKLIFITENDVYITHERWKLNRRLEGRIPLYLSFLFKGNRSGHLKKL